MILTNTHRSRTHKLNSKTELENHTDSNSLRLNGAKVKEIIERRGKNIAGSKRFPNTLWRRSRSKIMINRNILITIRWSRINIMRKRRGTTTRRPNNHLTRRIISNNTRIGGNRFIIKTIITINSKIKGVVSNACRRRHHLRTDGNRNRLKTEAIVHHTGVKDAARGSINIGAPVSTT